MKNCGIYAIRNIFNNDVYIGQSKNIKHRKLEHFWKLRNGVHHSPHLQNAFRKYGQEIFKFEILLLCESNELTYYEQALVNILKPAYNVCLTCVSTLEGVHPSEETRRKMSISQKGKLRPPVTEETRRNLSIAHMGKTISDETRQKMSDARKGKPLSDQNKRNLSIANTGKKPSEATREKLIRSHTGKKLSAETKRKMSEAKKGKPGRPLSDETKKKLAQINTGRKKSEETKKKMSLAHLKKSGQI